MTELSRFWATLSQDPRRRDLPQALLRQMRQDPEAGPARGGHGRQRKVEQLQPRDVSGSGLQKMADFDGFRNVCTVNCMVN